MTPPNKFRFFFIHLMKTGGTSFTEHLRANFTADQRYPDACMQSSNDFFRRMEAYLHVPRFVSDINAMAGKLRIVPGHVPYAVRSILEEDYVAITLLRNPVDRTISYLKHCRRYHPEHGEKTLQEIYEDPWFYASFICNYQTKIFSMSSKEALAEDRLLVNAPRIPPRRELGDGQNLSPELTLFRDRSPGRFSLECFAASTGVIHVDDQRLAIAKENLAAVDVVGVTPHYDRFLNQLVDRYNWDIKPLPHRHVGEGDTISPEFRRRIASDNAFDMELYEHAMALSE
jgi:Sulfotransferase family